MTDVALVTANSLTANSQSYSNSDAGNAILIAGRQTSAGGVGTVTYGGVSIPFLGFQASNGAGGGGDGVALWGTVGSLPTGANTITFSAYNSWGGVATYSNPDSFGTVFKAFGGNYDSAGDGITVTGTTTGGRVYAASCGGSDGPLSAISPATLPWFDQDNNSSGSGNGWGVETASNGGSVTPTWKITGSDDWWGMVAVEILPAGASGTDSSPAYASAFSDLGDGTGSWVNGANAEGSPDATYATWTAP